MNILRANASIQMSLQRGINLRALAEKMGQCSGAEVRGICTEAGMYALRERRQHVTQEDFEFAVAKVRFTHILLFDMLHGSHLPLGLEEEPGYEHLRQQALLVDILYFCVSYASYLCINLEFVRFF